MLTLIGAYFSPWSEKARWALDHHGVDYRYREHVPVLGELALRVRLRAIRGRVSVPALLFDGKALRESFDIARYADSIGTRRSLFPAEHGAAIAAWNARSEVALAAGRALYLDRLLRDPAAQVDMQPRAFPAWIRRASAPMTGAAIAFMRRKYAIGPEVLADAESTLDRELANLSHSLSQNRPFLLGHSLTYADIAMAVTLQFVSPVDTKYVPLGASAIAVWTHPELAARYSDLVQWRDALYTQHRLLPD